MIRITMTILFHMLFFVANISVAMFIIRYSSPDIFFVTIFNFAAAGLMLLFMIDGIRMDKEIIGIEKRCDKTKREIEKLRKQNSLLKSKINGRNTT